jgi:hypothetical protein
MGDWIKENKFEAGLLFLAILALIGAYIVGGGQGRKYDEHKEYYEIEANKKKGFESKSPYPANENEAEYGEVMEEYRGVIEALQAKFLEFRPAAFASIAPSEFTDKLNTKREALATRYSSDGIEYPDEKWQLGFEKYTATPPRDEATAYLSYQLDALDWLFGALADAKPSALVNVYRKELPVEAGEPMDGKKDTGRRGPARPSDSAEQKPFYVLPLELTFRATEPSVRAFLAQVASNNKHFFVIRTMRVQNEKRDKPPKKDDVNFEAKADPGAFIPSFDIIPDEPAPEGETPAPDGEPPAPEGGTPPPADPTGEEPLFPTDPVEESPEPVPGGGGGGDEDGERVLGQILGSEEVFVFLNLELLLSKDQAQVEEESGLPPLK